jgi:drug/metabolite transporter (DMT)-like permease
MSSRTGLAGLAGRLWHAPTLLLSFAALSWSGNFIVGRAVRDSVPPVALSFWRWTVGLLIILAFAWPHLRRDWPTLLRHWRILAVLSAAGISAFNTLIYLGLQSTTALNAVLMQSAMPLVILLFSFALHRERTHAVQMLGIAVSLAGVAAIASQGSLAALLALSLNVGDAWVLAAVVSYALYSTLLRHRPQVHPLSFVAASFALGAVMLLPLLAWEIAAGHTLKLNAAAIGAIAYVGLVPAVLAYLCFNRGVQLFGPNRAGQFMHLMPVFGSLLAVGVLGERLELHHMLGIGLIAIGLLLGVRTRR